MRQGGRQPLSDNHPPSVHPPHSFPLPTFPQSTLLTPSPSPLSLSSPSSLLPPPHFPSVHPPHSFPLPTFPQSTLLTPSPSPLSLSPPSSLLPPPHFPSVHPPHSFPLPTFPQSTLLTPPSSPPSPSVYFYNYGWLDYGVPTLESILDMVKVVDFALRGGKVAIHCHAGLGRTGVLIACYLVYSQRMSGDEAITLVRSNRCVVVRRPVHPLSSAHTPPPIPHTPSSLPTHALSSSC